MQNPPEATSPPAARASRLPKLYAILDVDLALARGLEPMTVFEVWIGAGVRLVQLRAKALADGALVDLAARMGSLAAQAGVQFILNDRADLAVLAHADGVHVGQEDLAPAAARQIVGIGRLVGLSTHNARQVRAGLDEPVDYLAVGPVFATTSKANPDPLVGLAGVTEAATMARRVARPVVAIGGITVAEAPRVIAAGADSVAVISDLLWADPERCRQYVKTLE